MIRIACVGDNCIDCYDATGEAFPGGNPVNVAVYVRRLGEASSYTGVVGDLFKDFSEEFLSGQEKRERTQ